MFWKNLQAQLRSLLGGKGSASSLRPDGGTSCYRPVQRRNRQEDPLAREMAAEYAAGQGQIENAHTGFTGMNPPMTGAAPVQSTYMGDPYGYGAAQAMRQGTREGAAWPGSQAGAPGAWQPVFQGNQPAYAGGAAVPSQGGAPGFSGGAAPSGEMPRPAENISYMPGVYMPDAGSSFTHVEHVMAITSLRSCYEAIECMKNGETLIVTLDVLGSEGEKIRCQDMLAGAAFTLRCTVRPLPGAGVVVIAPETVKILPEQQPSRFESAGAYVPQVQPMPAEERPYRRERRVSQNAVGWENAGRAGGQGFNPYTGSMPAAAGSYGMYGGY